MESGPSWQSNFKSRQSDEYSISAPRRKGTPPLFFGTRRLGSTNHELLERLKSFQQNLTDIELVSITDKNATTSKETEHIPIHGDCVIEVGTSKQSSRSSSESPRLQQVVNLSTDEITKLQKNVSRQWLGLLLILFPMLLLFGYGLLDEIADWHTNGKVTSFGHKEKKIALFLSYGLMTFWMVLLVLALVVFWDSW